jgi:microcystin-dependent protein
VAPAGHELLDGGAISRTTYPVLFDLWGTSFGSGDGSTTFNKPDRRGRVGVGRNAGDVDFDTIGETGGSKSTLKRTDAGDSNLAVDTTAGTQNVAANDHKHSLMPFMVVNYIVRAG